MTTPTGAATPGPTIEAECSHAECTAALHAEARRAGQSPLEVESICLPRERAETAQWAQECDDYDERMGR